MNDPRNEPDFNPRWLPKCDGKPGPKRTRGTAKRTRGTVLEVAQQKFLAAYYRVNAAYARRLELRAQTQPPAAPARERAVLRRIERALVALEKLEDHYASRGITASPVYHRGLAVNLRFQHAGAQKAPPKIILSSASRRLTFAPPVRPTAPPHSQA